MEQAPPKWDAKNIADILNDYSIHSLLFLKFISIVTTKCKIQPGQNELRCFFV
jgi:hypothetical protein